MGGAEKRGKETKILKRGLQAGQKGDETPLRTMFKAVSQKFLFFWYFQKMNSFKRAFVN